MLETLGLDRARLVVISYDDVPAALAILNLVRRLRPGLPVMVRTRDESNVEQLQAAGSMEVVPETLEAGLMIASQALLLLDVPLSRVMRRIQEQRSGRYHLMKEFFHGDALSQGMEEKDAHRLRSIAVPPASGVIGQQLQELGLDGVTVTALVRSGARKPAPSLDTVLQAGDVIVVYGEMENIQRVKQLLRE